MDVLTVNVLLQMLSTEGEAARRAVYASSRVILALADAIAPVTHHHEAICASWPVGVAAEISALTASHCVRRHGLPTILSVV